MFFEYHLSTLLKVNFRAKKTSLAKIARELVVCCLSVNEFDLPLVAS